MKKMTILTMAVLLLLGASAQADLVALWHLDGDATDSSGNGNDGTIYGPAFDAGLFGQALSFDGADDYVEVGQDGSLDMTGAYTLEAWVNVTDDLLPNKYRPILFRGTANANDIEVYVQAVSKDLIVAHNRGNGGTFDYVGFADPPLGTWFHLAVTFDGTDVKAYYNGGLAGVVQQNTAVSAPLDTDNGWWIGKVDHSAFNYLGSGPLHYFKGTLDEVRIWDEALSANEIEDSYELGGAQPDATVVVLGEEQLPSGDWVIFTSSFYGLNGTCPIATAVPDTLNIYMMSNGPAVISGVSERTKPYTPRGTSGCWGNVGSTGGTSITADVGSIDCKSIHLSLDLDTGDSVGFNAQFLPYD